MASSSSRFRSFEFGYHPEFDRCLRPQIPLTFEELATYGFDPNAEVLLALEDIRR